MHENMLDDSPLPGQSTKFKERSDFKLLDGSNIVIDNRPLSERELPEEAERPYYLNEDGSFKSPSGQ